jgi:hypothetical protein
LALTERTKAIQKRAHIRQQLLKQMLNYAQLTGCRRQYLLTYFGDTTPPSSPRCCDNHTASQIDNLPKAVTAQEWFPLIVLETVRSLQERPIGRSRLAQLLNGSRSKHMQEFGYERHRFFGKLHHLSQRQLVELIDSLLAARYLRLGGGELPVLSLTPLGQQALAARAALPLQTNDHRDKAIERPPIKNERLDTVQITLDLFRQGLTPAQITAERNLAESTIYTHLARLISDGQIELAEVVAAAIEAQVLQAVNTIGSAAALAPLKAILAEDISFDQIKCVLAAHPELPSGPLEVASSTKPEQRVVLLGQLGSPEGIPELIQALNHTDGNVRRLAASALGKIGDARAVEPLLALLSNETRPQVRQYAIKALGRIGAPNAATLLEQIVNNPAEVDYNLKAAQDVLARLQKFQPQPVEPIAAPANNGPNTTSPSPIAIVLEAVAALDGTLGRTGLTKLLTGSKAGWLAPFTQNIYYGQLAYLSQQGVLDLIDALIADGRLVTTGGNWPKLKLPGANPT